MHRRLLPYTPSGHTLGRGSANALPVVGALDCRDRLLHRPTALQQ
ncbi:hypothetical protein ACFOPN_07830 [Xanthomonas hyacinthi]